MARVEFFVTCIATYESELAIPNDIANDKNAVLEYIHEHLENACIADCSGLMILNQMKQ